MLVLGVVPKAKSKANSNPKKAGVEDAQVKKAAPKPMRKKTKKIEAKTSKVTDAPATKATVEGHVEEENNDVEIAPLVKTRGHRRGRSGSKKAVRGVLSRTWCIHVH